jgi:uncharacterized protein
MQFLRRLALVAVLAAAGFSGTARAETPPSPEAMEAAQALFTQLFTHGFVALNTQAVETAWPGIERALRAQKPDLSAATLAELKQEFARIRLARLSEIVKDVPALYVRYLSAEDMRTLAAFYGTPTGARMLQVLPVLLPEAFATVLPRVQSMAGETRNHSSRCCANAACSIEQTDRRPPPQDADVTRL